MITTRTTRTLGLLGVLGGACLLAVAVLQMIGSLGPTTDEVLSTVGFLGLAAALIGLLRMGAAPSRPGRAGLWIWIVGVLSISAAGIVGAMFSLSEDSNLLLPAGGIGQLIGGLVAGIAIGRAGVLEGWLRWAPLAWAVTFAVSIPFGFTDSRLSAVLFAVFGLAAIATSAGVATASTPVRDTERTPTAAVS